MDGDKYIGFSRNRRFLIGVSLGLACAHYLGLRIEEVSILGNSARISKPNSVTSAAIIVWLWAWVKYIYWFFDAGAWTEISHTATQHCRSKLELREQKRPIPDAIAQKVKDAFKTYSSSNQEPMENAELVSRSNGHSGYEEKQAIVISLKALMRWQGRLPGTWNYSHHQIAYEVPIEDDEYRRAWTRSLFIVVFMNRFFVEYLAPFLIGLTPLIAWLSGLYS